MMNEIRTTDAGRGVAWLIEGFDYFRRSAGAWIGICLLFLAINVASALIPLVGMLAMQLLVPVFMGGLLMGCRDIAARQGLQINHLFSGFKQDFGNLVVIGLIYLVVSVLIMIFMGIIMVFAVGMEFLSSAINQDPEIINNYINNAQFTVSILLVLLVGLSLYLPLLMAFWFAPALAVFEGKPPLESMKMSFLGCLKNIIPFLIYGVVGLVLSILATIPLGLGWFIMFPVFIASIYLAYLDIFSPDQAVVIQQV